MCMPFVAANPFMPTAKRFVGELSIGFHNKREGFSSDDTRRIEQTRAMMLRGDLWLWGACELNQTPANEPNGNGSGKMLTRPSSTQFGLRWAVTGDMTTEISVLPLGWVSLVTLGRAG